MRTGQSAANSNRVTNSLVHSRSKVETPLHIQYRMESRLLTVTVHGRWKVTSYPYIND